MKYVGEKNLNFSCLFHRQIYMIHVVVMMGLHLFGAPLSLIKDPERNKWQLQLSLIVRKCPQSWLNIRTDWSLFSSELWIQQIQLALINTRIKVPPEVAGWKSESAWSLNQKCVSLCVLDLTYQSNSLHAKTSPAEQMKTTKEGRRRPTVYSVLTWSQTWPITLMTLLFRALKTKCTFLLSWLKNTHNRTTTGIISMDSHIQCL